MRVRRVPILVHLTGAALAGALAVYWLLRLFAPAPPVAPSAPPSSTFREPDSGLAARLLGDVGGGPALNAPNIQVSGVFSANKDSSAVITVDGRPPRAVLLGRDVVAGFRLVEVRPDGITLEHQGMRTRYAVPAPNVAKASATAPMFSREGDTLTAPSQEVASTTRTSSDSARAYGAAGAPAPGAQSPPGASGLAPAEEFGASARGRPRQSPVPSPPAPPPSPGTPGAPTGG